MVYRKITTHFEQLSVTIIAIMSVVPLGTQVVYKSSPAFSAPSDKPEITPAVLPNDQYQNEKLTV
jgi:hypothetical protein